MKSQANKMVGLGIFTLCILLLSCNKLERKTRLMILERKSRYSVNFLGETWKKSYQVIYDKSRNKKAEGNYALTRDGEVGAMKVGEWVEYYPVSGKIKSKGNYKIGYYPFCCITPCIRFYNYKDGFWEYFYEDGSIKANGDYQLGEFNISNNCSGGAMIQLGMIDEDWFLSEEIKDSIHNWDILKEFHLIQQEEGRFYSNIGVNGVPELVFE